MGSLSSSDTDRAVIERSMQKFNDQQIWSEPLDTPGYIPKHLKRSATAQFPILEISQRLLYRLQPASGGIEKILALIGLYQAVQPVYRHLKEFLAWAFTVQVTIPEHDVVAKDVLAWMGTNVIQSTRSAMLVTGGVQDANDDFHRRMVMASMGRGNAVLHSGDDEVLCLPPIGTRLFWVGFRPYIFSRRGSHIPQLRHTVEGNLLDSSSQLQNSITIMTIGWSLEPLRDFTRICHEFRAHNMTGTTTVYFAADRSTDPYGNGWQSVSKAIRKMDTIDMDENIKSDIIRDADHYYSDKSRQFFADCGIPYRRGYLFHGPPGTGKSSFCIALAGHLECDIYYINLVGITDVKLHRLFLGLPRKCIVVIEDIDSAGITREVPADIAHLKDKELRQGENTADFLAAQAKKPVSKPTNSLVTLSGLLNAVDGNASQEGRLLIMTSNHPDALDEALTRPGRIDKKIAFGYMTKAGAKSIFKRLLGRSAEVNDAAFTTEQIDQLACDFAKKVPEGIFSPAQIQNFLQDCRGNIYQAVAEIDTWVGENQHKSKRPSSIHQSPSTVGVDINDTSRDIVTGLVSNDD